MSLRILMAGAHPDDAEIYTGGTLAAYTARGDEVHIAVATDGAAGGAGDPGALRKARRTEARVGARRLGAKLHLLDFPDGALVADAKLIAALRALIGKLEPDLVITHAPNDYHGDHRALSDAVRIAANFNVPVLWTDNLMGVGTEPTHLVDISAHVDVKRESIRAHVSQDPERFVAMAEQLNAFRAAQANQPAGSTAEAFRFAPQFPYVDIRDLLPPAPPVMPLGDRRKAKAGSPGVRRPTAARRAQSSANPRRR